MFSRVVIIAPRRSDQKAIEWLLSQPLRTTPLTRHHGRALWIAISELAAGGFGVVADAGMGKKSLIPRICQAVLGNKQWLIGKVLRSTSAVRGSSTILIVSAPAALAMARQGAIGSTDLVITLPDASNPWEFELAVALLRHTGCTFVWLSCAIDPITYRSQLGSRHVITCEREQAPAPIAVSAPRTHNRRKETLVQGIRNSLKTAQNILIYMPHAAAAVGLINVLQREQLDACIVRYCHLGQEQRQLAHPSSQATIVIATHEEAAALYLKNIHTIFVDDRQFHGADHIAPIVRSSWTRAHDNLLLQIVRANTGSTVRHMYIYTDRTQSELDALRPAQPPFALNSYLEQVALAASRSHLKIDELALPGEALDRPKYDRVFHRLVERDLIAADNDTPSLTFSGQQIEAMPVSTAWGEIILRALAMEDPELLRVICLTACAPPVFDMIKTKNGWQYLDDPLTIPGSDHLTAYNIVAQALFKFGKIDAGGYGLIGAEFVHWCNKSGYRPNSLRTAVARLHRLYDHLGVKPHGATRFRPVRRNDALYNSFVELLAAAQSMAYSTPGSLYDKQKVTVCSAYALNDSSSVLGTIRTWRDRNSTPLCCIEGTEIPPALVKRYASRRFIEIVRQTGNDKLIARLAIMFAGQEVEQIEQEVAPSEIPAAVLEQSSRSHIRACWENWTDRPDIRLPSLDDLSIPEIIRCQYGINLLGNEPLIAYGLVALRSGAHPARRYFRAFWTKDADTAQRLHQEATALLQTQREAITTNLRFRQCSEQAAALHETLNAFGAQTNLAPKAQRLIEAQTEPPRAYDLAGIESWLAQANAALAEARALESQARTRPVRTLPAADEADEARTPVAQTTAPAGTTADQRKPKLFERLWQRIWGTK